MNPITKAYGQLKQIPRRRRLLYEWAMLIAVVLLLMGKVCYIRSHCYAVTYSLGNGRGIILYTALYDKLPPILQESVRDHEERHLEVGSYAFWKNSQLEIDAYSHQIKLIDHKIAVCEELFRYTGDYKYQINRNLLKDFRKDMVALMHIYEGKMESESEKD